MIIGHGIDIVSLERFYQIPIGRLDKMANRILTEQELSNYKTISNPKKPVYIAKIWASKEAISKAIGTGIQENTTWKSMNIQNNALGKPEVKLEIPNAYCLLSISHEKEYLVASAILCSSDQT